MHVSYDRWYSPNLSKDMEIAVYGHYGDIILMFPTAGADYKEYERFGLIWDIQNVIDNGKFKVVSINSINMESWLNDNMEPRNKAIRHIQFNDYVISEVVPYIYTICNGQIPIYTCGASFGALHAANNFFRRPDLFNGVIAMSGVYDLKAYTNGYYDDDVYFNSPTDYLQNLNDDYYLNKIRKSRHIHLLSGSGDYEDPEAARWLSKILSEKNIEHDLDIWGYDIPHEWNTWKKMLPHVLNEKF